MVPTANHKPLKFEPPVEGERCMYCGEPVQQTNGMGGDLYRCVMTNCGKWMLREEVKRDEALDTH